MGCKASKKKEPVAVGVAATTPGSLQSTKVDENDKNSLKNSSNSSKRPPATPPSKEAAVVEKKQSISAKPPSLPSTDISKLTTEKFSKISDAKKLTTLEELTCKPPSIEGPPEGGENGKTPLTTDPTATPRAGSRRSRRSCSRRGRQSSRSRKSKRKLQPAKPDNGEYINFNDILSDEDFEDDKKKEGKEGKNEEKKKDEKLKEETAREEAGREEKEEEEEKMKEETARSEVKEAKEVVEPTAHPSLSAAPTQEKLKSKSARSMKAKEEKAAAAAPKEPPGVKTREPKNGVNDLRTGAVRARRLEDTLYQVPHRMPEVDFTKLH